MIEIIQSCILFM